jgi:hypothetical protein
MNKMSTPYLRSIQALEDGISKAQQELRAIPQSANRHRQPSLVTLYGVINNLEETLLELRKAKGDEYLQLLSKIKWDLAAEQAPSQEDMDKLNLLRKEAYPQSTMVFVIFEGNLVLTD